MKHYTTLEQSKKLVELGLNPDTADMVIVKDNTYYNALSAFNGVTLCQNYNETKDKTNYIPCWSLGALLDVMPKIQEDDEDGGCCPDLCKGWHNGQWHCVYRSSIHITKWYDNSIEAAFEMVCWLLENGYIKRRIKMDYKQKYEQALERAKVINPGTADYEVVVKIFPELKQSKDERIRKALIHLISEQDGFLTAINGISVKDILAWLERQDEQKDKNNRRPLNFNEIVVGDIITYFRDGKKGIMLVSSFDSGIYPRCKWGISDITGTAYGDWSPGVGTYYVATEEEKQKLLNTMPKRIKEWFEKQHRQKPTWSDKDEKMLKLSLENLTELKNRFGEKYGKVGDCIQWLESIKERMKGE